MLSATQKKYGRERLEEILREHRRHISEELGAALLSEEPDPKIVKHNRKLRDQADKRREAVLIACREIRDEIILGKHDSTAVLKKLEQFAKTKF